VLYYAAEKDGLHATHPRADIWFRTTDDEVVLIDIFGGQSPENFADKVQNLQDLTDDWNRKLEFKGLTFFGVVLAPSMPGPSKGTSLDKVQQVLGRDARNLLGGLDQVFRWFDNNNNNGDEKGEEEVISREDTFLVAARSKKWKVSGKKKYLKDQQQIDHRTIENARLMPRANDPADYMTLVDMLCDSWAKNGVSEDSLQGIIAKYHE
jgi:hypothetical protein